MIVLTKTDNGKEISVARDSVIEIRIDEAGATGYSWDFDDLDGQYFEVLGSETKTQDGRGLTGAPVTKIWRLKARKEGNAEIKMYCYRAWEGKEKAVDEFKVHIRIL